MKRPPLDLNVKSCCLEEAHIMIQQRKDEYCKKWDLESDCKTPKDHTVKKEKQEIMREAFTCKNHNTINIFVFGNEVPSDLISKIKDIVDSK